MVIIDNEKMGTGKSNEFPDLTAGRIAHSNPPIRAHTSPYTTTTEGFMLNTEKRASFQLDPEEAEL